MMPPPWLPGMMSLARAPAMRPRMIQLMIPMMAPYPSREGLLLYATGEYPWNTLRLLLRLTLADGQPPVCSR
jgi:hypothetical protein